MNAEMPAAVKQKRLILLTGASGYIGGRLLRTLYHRLSHHAVCLASGSEWLIEGPRMVNRHGSVRPAHYHDHGTAFMV